MAGAIIGQNRRHGPPKLRLSEGGGGGALRRAVSGWPLDRSHARLSIIQPRYSDFKALTPSTASHSANATRDDGRRVLMTEASHRRWERRHPKRAARHHFGLPKTDQTACKPGSVPALEAGMTIHLGRPLPGASRDRPGRRRGNAPEPLRSRPAVPTWSCSRWGLPCRRRCRRRGALLPHHFTLAARRRSAESAVCFCGTFPRVAPAGRYPAPCFRGARTFLYPRKDRQRSSGHLARQGA